MTKDIAMYENVEGDCQLVCEALVREIRDAQRWSAVLEAWQALSRVRQRASSMLAEQRRYKGNVVEGDR